MITWIRNWIKLWQHRRKYRKQLEELKKRDPFIYH